MPGVGLGLGRRRGRAWTVGGGSGVSPMPFQIGHYMGSGQSHKNGSVPSVVNPTLALSTVPDSRGWMFAGPRPRDYDLSVRYATFQPMAAQNKDGSPVSFFAEDPGHGFLKMLAQLLLDEDGIDMSVVDFKVLNTNDARTGHQLLDIMRGTPSYDDFLRDVDEAQIAAAAQGKSYGPLGSFLSIGRQDYLLNTDPAAFTDRLMTIAQQKHDDFLAETGSIYPLITYVRQNSTHAYGGHSLNPDIAHATLEAIRQLPDLLKSVGPMNDHVIGVHHESEESFLEGESDAVACKRDFFDGVEPVIFAPVSVTGLGTSTIRVRYPLPVDWMLQHKVLTKPAYTTNLPKQARFGHRLLKADGSERTQSSDPVIVGDTVVLTASGTDAVTHTYGDPIQGGNLRMLPTAGALLGPVYDHEVTPWALFTKTAIAA